MRSTTHHVLELPTRLGGPMDLQTLVSDFTGTISVDGELVPGVESRIRALADLGVRIVYMTADTQGTAKKVLDPLPVETIKVEVGEDKPKRIRERGFDMDHTVVMGNGRNDMAMFRIALFGIAVMEAEGLSGGLLGICIQNEWPVVRSACDALDLLLKLKRVQATNRD